MSMYKSFMVLFGFGIFLIALLALIVSLINRKSTSLFAQEVTRRGLSNHWTADPFGGTTYP
ncbi:putative holin-like toxin [Gracilibacillus sp. S3-1-1]|uniref:Holin-like toxin n=1 Tax=Gracilibacillus pellucidus TaxID=3095368 RepID=A0ACC6M324_9BACI|nr:putative holin-like toxin [Gracilibacillus sp. S3-1-1]MDX8045356.1 putative holin-like toxin [Gracilibacillus sp. S3-1-1]